MIRYIEHHLAAIRNLPPGFSFHSDNAFAENVLKMIQSNSTHDILGWLQAEHQNEICKIFLWKLLFVAQQCVVAYETPFEASGSSNSHLVFAALGRYLLPIKEKQWEIIAKKDPLTVQVNALLALFRVNQYRFLASNAAGQRAIPPESNSQLTIVYGLLQADSAIDPLAYIAANHSDKAAINTIRYILSCVFPSRQAWDGCKKNYSYHVEKRHRKAHGVRFSFSDFCSAGIGSVVSIHVMIPRSLSEEQNAVFKLTSDCTLSDATGSSYVICYRTFTGGTSTLFGDKYSFRLYCYPQLPSAGWWTLTLTQNTLEAWIPANDRLVRVDEKKFPTFRWRVYSR
jgi:hypothetical protein